MDIIDKRILHILHKNARITASDISNQINLSVSAVGDRLKKLEASGMIENYTTILNSTMLGKSLTAIIMVALERPKYAEVFEVFVNNEKDILDCYYLAGDYDYALKIVTKDTATLETLIGKIKNVEGLLKTKTTIVLSTIKDVHSVLPEL
ncbi:MAG: Lrp/AsnC family transcriptional regulator [Firmicutes bacterium HGW-Firmicutes-3]|nr:MAG: Lrp/AsnC family transcriptional regulator [Firmicutes bacterium HGW-Firmicutes-3]